ncbi:MAG TPA: methyltransferase [Verrucomicrobiae bacterium]|nr:methyltransferase [Verrucomicrobiae bacterium]
MRHGALKALSLIGYLVMAVSAVALIEIGAFFSALPVVIAVQTAAVALLAWARIAFGRRSFHFAANPTEGGLVTSGPYRYIRHPIYTAFCVFVWAGVLAHWSSGAGLCGGLALGGALLRIFCEETLVVARYPEYRQYAAKTWRMIPYIF